MPFFVLCSGVVMAEYKTVEIESCDEFVEKRSRFIGYVKPVSNQNEAVSFINSIKSKHWDAAHNVYAYVLRENNIRRFSDDGEPSGTAGMPVLDVILKNELVNVCVVVTRYFGGVLLGAGGLVRAYSHASKIAVESGKIITMAPCKVMSASVDYSFFDRLTGILGDFGANIRSTQFTDKVTAEFTVKSEKAEMLECKLVDVSNGAYTLKEIGECFAKV